MTSNDATPAQRLRALIREAEDGRPNDFDLWRERVRAVLVRHYGDADHPEVRRFADLLFPGLVRSDRTLASGEFAAAELRGLGRGVALLSALVEQLEADESRGHDAGALPHDAIEKMDLQVREADPSVVWVVHGRNLAARNGMFAFLRALGLKPLEWDQAVALTGKGSPYVGEVLSRAFDSAGAVVVLMTPDEVAYLRPEYAASDHDPDARAAPQARPNVLFEAGMALGRDPDRTIIVELGAVRAFSDIAGRHVVRLDGGAESRKALAQRLQNAGVVVDMSGRDWLTVGELSPPEDPGGGLPLGRRIPASAQARRVRLDARYQDRGSGGRLEIINRGTVAIHNLDIEIPDEVGPSFRVLTDDLPIEVLPSGKSVFLIASHSIAPGRDHFMIKITGVSEDGESVSEDAFVSLLG